MPMFDRRLVQYFDWGLLGLTFLIAAFGLATLYSAVHGDPAPPHRSLFVKQMIWYGGGLAVMTAIFLFSYKFFDRWAYIFYFFCNALLVWVLLFGKYVSGARRWIDFGPVSLQPSELIKIGVIIVLARFYSRFATTRGFTLRELVTPLLLVMLPFFLIVKQPDLGTTLLVLLIAGTMTAYVKIERRSLIYLIAAGAVAVPLVWSYLKGYQKQRILTFLDPDRDPLGAGYHIIQSKIAIGSGMLTGKGFRQGTQNALSFLPEQHTDFIFSVFSEEWGFLGAMAMLVVFLVMILWGLNIAYNCRDQFGAILCVGVTAMIFWQVFINIGMVMGLMPVVGVPLPFVSYGGSSILTIMVCVGILLNVSMRRFLFE